MAYTTPRYDYETQALQKVYPDRGWTLPLWDDAGRAEARALGRFKVEIKSSYGDYVLRTVTFRCEARGKDQQPAYWYAYQKVNTSGRRGDCKLRKVYVGRWEELSPDAVRDACSRLGN